MATPRIAIIGNPDKPRVTDAIAKIRPIAEKYGTITNTILDLAPQNITCLSTDFVFALGGDGTILSVARALANNPIPIVGVNLGKLGYLAEFSVDQLLDSIETVLHDHALISERMLLDVSVTDRKGQAVFSSQAINDICLMAGPPFRMVELEVGINGQLVAHISGDGLIVSSPTGSTAYNMAVGGPILLPRVRGIALSPIAPHALTFRPIVVDCESKITVTMPKTNEGSTLMVDGQLSSPMTPDLTVEIKNRDAGLRLVRNPASPPWHTLITKLGWGRRPNYNE